MNYSRNKWLLILLPVLSSCFPEEIPVERKPRINASVLVDAGPSRDFVSFFSFAEGKIIARENPMNWDVYADDRGVFMNGFRSMQAAPFSGTWASVKDTAGLRFRYLTMDYETHMWMLKPDTNYVIRLGLNNDYEQMPSIKFRYTASANGWEIFSSSLGDSISEKTILEDESVYYSIQNKTRINLPAPGSYDLAFGRYTDFVTFVSQSIDYLVFGALQGEAKAVQIMKPFDQVTVNDFDSVSFPDHQRGIGWDWKYYNIEKAAYSIREDRSYLIRSKNGYKYKMRFVNFYNNLGVSGHPTIEYLLF